MKDRTILVTGASSGIGRAVCEALLTRGCQVVGVARDFSKFPLQNQLLEAAKLELGDLEALPDQLQQLMTRHPDISGVVCAAGFGRFGSLEEFSFQQIRDLMDVNLISTTFLARVVIPVLKQRGSGDLIFIGSEAGLSGGKFGAVYSATKFGLRGLAQALRQECSSNGVRVCVINPGMVQTEFFNKLDFAPGKEEANYILPEEVAECVLTILSSRQGTVIDEINLSPQKKVVRKK